MENELSLRLGFFFSILLIIATWEYIKPKRNLRIKRATRWSRNLLLITFNNIAIKILLPFTAASVAIYATQNQIGILNYFNIPFALSVIISLLLLDFFIYLQHVIFHHTPALWRLHKIHHIDQDIDVTTGIRFHPIEILLSTLIKCSAVLILGVPFIAIVIFEIILNAIAMFNHGNISLPKKLDKYLQLIIVTPDMHRIHHSTIIEETNSNFGFNLPWWDKIFKTYQAQPAKGHLKMEIGISEYQDANKTGIIEILTIPFKKQRS